MLSCCDLLVTSITLYLAQVTTGGYSVPMLCAGGNCQGDLPGFLVSRPSLFEPLGISKFLKVDTQIIPRQAVTGLCCNLYHGLRPGHGGPCNIDERLSTSGIAEVVQSIDISILDCEAVVFLKMGSWVCRIHGIQ